MKITAIRTFNKTCNDWEVITHILLNKAVTLCGESLIGVKSTPPVEAHPAFQIDCQDCKDLLSNNL